MLTFKINTKSEFRNPKHFSNDQNSNDKNKIKKASIQLLML
jgi:hypothetical protein